MWSVGDLTWLDHADEHWPYPLKTRADTVDAASVGIRGTKYRREFEVVVWVGGWADVMSADYDLDEVRVDAPAIPNAEALEAVLLGLSQSWQET
jgi:hypothetical protein